MARKRDAKYARAHARKEGRALLGEVAFVAIGVTGIRYCGRMSRDDKVIIMGSGRSWAEAASRAGWCRCPSCGSRFCRVCELCETCDTGACRCAPDPLPLLAEA